MRIGRVVTLTHPLIVIHAIDFLWPAYCMYVFTVIMYMLWTKVHAVPM